MLFNPVFMYGSLPFMFRVSIRLGIVERKEHASESENCLLRGNVRHVW